MKKKIFLTGATGNWGQYILREFAQRADRFDVTALVLPTAKDTAIIRNFEGMENLRVVYGDVTDYPTVLSCVTGADYVLHTGAVVSPFADDHPELAHKVNVGGARNVIKAVKSQPDPDKVRLVTIGTVAQSGDRNPPNHWGRVGDPLRVSHYDEYGQSKVIAERELIDSGLKNFVSLRQTGIFHPGILEIRDPIMTHTPLAGVLEWVSVEDASRLLANICEDGVPQEFWGGIYNIGGGESWRLTNWDLQTSMTAAMGVKDARKWYDRNWFATGNFHGFWYTDSDVLESLVPFRKDTFQEALHRAVAAAPAGVRLAGKIPAPLIKHLVMKPLTKKPRGTMAWIEANDTAKIDAYFGSRQEWENIGDWSTFWPPRPDKEPQFLDHGYDENKDPTDWTLADMKEAAEFRGGTLTSTFKTTGDISKPLPWECAAGHSFHGSPRLILTAGHWCPECVKNPADYPNQAAANRFLAQLEPKVPANA
ncbi:NAD-dependent epimerase/dehydratase family protein [Paenarthrobacter nitroguajacolicus]|uniref:NAD-dependent epimerase/dehydratase family protein n=1 Tax=Paenarthrobacter nitroguajacolicus TaxID=211146 RepID=UPI001B7701A5|nr:NAD-dependent epimerase/dehydratase family protein [Paenarthrobacter nitroguajacolicus]MDR6639509.1 nucleoside-diphosphate-sugar epimerase [Paenarthrobacter nitroguajacolicus]